MPLRRGDGGQGQAAVPRVRLLPRDHARLHGAGPPHRGGVRAARHSPRGSARHLDEVAAAQPGGAAVLRRAGHVLGAQHP